MRKDLRNAAKAIPEELVQLAVKTHSGATYFAEVLDLSARGVETRFDRESMPTLAVGQPAQLAFRSPRFANPLELRAIVEFRIESEAARGYGFRFEPTPELDDSLQSLFALVNQRHAHRVRPRMTESVDVVLEIPSSSDAPRGAVRAAKGVLRDISFAGLSVWVRPEAELHFAGVEWVGVTVHLPTAGSPCSLLAWIRNRRVDDKGVVYGLEIDTHRTADFEKRQREIVDYVMRRQREMLRVRSERETRAP